MSDWDLSLCHCLPLSRENAAKVLRFVLGEKKGSPLPWRTKAHISSVLQFFSPAAVKLPGQKDQTYEDMTSDGTPLQLLQLLLHRMCVCVFVCMYVFLHRGTGNTGGSSDSTVNILVLVNFAAVGRNRLLDKQQTHS